MQGGGRLRDRTEGSVKGTEGFGGGTVDEEDGVISAGIVEDEVEQGTGWLIEEGITFEVDKQLLVWSFKQLVL